MTACNVANWDLFPEMTILCNDYDYVMEENCSERSDGKHLIQTPWGTAMTIFFPLISTT